MEINPLFFSPVSSKSSAGYGNTKIMLDLNFNNKYT
jgi:hypothetical protein